MLAHSFSISLPLLVFLFAPKLVSHSFELFDFVEFDNDRSVFTIVFLYGLPGRTTLQSIHLYMLKLSVGVGERRWVLEL